MDWILIIIVAIIIISIIWFFIIYRRDLRKDEQIFEEYLENQRKIKFIKSESQLTGK